MNENTKDAMHDTSWNELNQTAILKWIGSYSDIDIDIN